jgi:hypothetical protein
MFSSFRWIAPLTLLLGVSFPSFAQEAEKRNDAMPSQAEAKMFMTDQLKSLPNKEVSLRYKFTKTGSFEAGYEDKISVQVGVPDPKQEDGRLVKMEFLTGDHKVDLPPVEAAHGNPVVMGFLERDVREMKRITGGSTNYYRKLIRMALVDTKEVKSVTLKFGGKEIKADEIVIDPFKNDPARSRYTRFANKIYTFDLSDQVPGGVVMMKSTMREGNHSGPVMIEETLSLVESK